MTMGEHNYQEKGLTILKKPLVLQLSFWMKLITSINAGMKRDQIDNRSENDDLVISECRQLGSLMMISFLSNFFANIIPLF